MCITTTDGNFGTKIHPGVLACTPVGIYYLVEGHIWELLGNYPVFTMVMVIYHYVERIG